MDKKWQIFQKAVTTDTPVDLESWKVIHTPRMT